MLPTSLTSEASKLDKSISIILFKFKNIETHDLICVSNLRVTLFISASKSQNFLHKLPLEIPFIITSER